MLVACSVPIAVAPRDTALPSMSQFASPPASWRADVVMAVPGVPLGGRLAPVHHEHVARVRLEPDGAVRRRERVQARAGGRRDGERTLARARRAPVRVGGKEVRARRRAVGDALVDAVRGRSDRDPGQPVAAWPPVVNPWPQSLALGSHHVARL